MQQIGFMTSAKILAIALMVALTGCETMKIASRPKAIRGVECVDSPYMKVFQVVDGGILAHICPTNYPSYYDDAFEACVTKGDTVFMEVPKEVNNFVDDQKITLEKNQCFVGNGTYSYTSSDGRRRTVRNIAVLQEEDAKSSEAPKKSQDDKKKSP